MKSLLLWLFIAIGPCLAFAQTKVNKSYPVAKGQTVSFHFDYPKTIHISTWEGKEVSVVATVKINNGESDEAFTLVDNTADGNISISNKLDMEKIPENFYILENGTKVKFNTKEDMEACKSTKGGARFSTYQQKDIEISIDIKVPANVATDITSVYGMVTVENFNGPIKVDAKYGGVDASITEKAIGKLQLTNRYGKIYTNLSLQPTEKTEKNFFTSITAVPGNGPSYNLSSSYGNIYLRKSL